MPATSCSTDIPRFWPPVGPNRNNRSWKTSSTWWPSAGFPSAPNAARIRERCGDVAIAFPSDEGRKTKWHCALVRAASALMPAPRPGRLSLPDVMRGQREIKQRADGNHGAVRQAEGFGVMDIQLLLAHIGRPAAFHLIDNKTDVPEGALDALAYRHQDQRHDAADDGGHDEDPEPVRPADDGAHRGHQLDVARAHGA